MTVKHQARQSAEIYRDQIRGCWVGKNIGGALGMPYEGCPGPLHVKSSDFCPVAIPNDDLELQLLWIWQLEEHGAGLRAAHLAKAFMLYECYPDEYGVSQWNTRRGLAPPLTGLHNNWFTDGMGAAIRSEIWACLFPGQPELAVAFAREDALIDHHGNGVWAEMFLAAAESAAFSCASVADALQVGLTFIPDECRLAQAVKRALDLHARAIPQDQACDSMVKEFGSHNFTDVTMNLAFITMALLYGNGDFKKTLVTAVNFGMDTDCTGATCGSMLGILLGADGIPDDWKEGMSDELAVSDCLKRLPIPRTIDETTRRTLQLADRMKSELGGSLPEDMTPGVDEDPENDKNQWLVFRIAGEKGYATDPVAFRKAQENPAAFKDQVWTSPGIHLKLNRFIKQPGDNLYLLTWIQVPEDLDGQILLCADTGLTAWLDEEMILNYHGRRKAVPAFHRTEGGASIPVRLKSGTPYSLKIRLIGCRAPLTLSVALGDREGRYVLGVTYRV